MSSCSFIPRISVFSNLFLERPSNLKNKVEDYQQKIAELISSTNTSPQEKMRVIQEIRVFLKDFSDKNNIPPFVISLEKSYLVARRTIFPNSFRNSNLNLEQTICKHDQKKLQKWINNGFTEGQYLENPAFVDFYFDAHLHKKLQFFKQNPVNQANGKMGLIVDGEFLESEKIVEKFIVNEGKIYSKETGEKWTYLQEGLVCYDPTNWNEPKPLMKLERPLGEGYFLQVVNFIKSPAEQGIMYAVLEGNEHSWVRVVDPEGKVYSFGWSFDPKSFAYSAPLNVIPAKVCSPDPFEAYASQTLETTIPISEESALKILSAISKYSKEPDLKFSWIKGNCSGFVNEILKVAGLSGDIEKNKVSLVTVICQLVSQLIPEVIKKPLNQILSFIGKYMIPSFVVKTGKVIFNLFLYLLGYFLGAQEFRNRENEGTPNANPINESQLQPELQISENNNVDADRQIYPFVETANRIGRATMLAFQDLWEIADCEELQQDISLWNVTKMCERVDHIFNSENLDIIHPGVVAAWQRGMGAEFTRVVNNFS